MIVVIDDHADMRAVAEQVLRYHFDDAVRVVAIPPEEWTSVDWDDVSVAIVDLMMPVPGRHILNWLRTHRPNVQRVVWTGYPDLLADDPTLADETIPKPSVLELGDTLEMMKPGPTRRRRK